MKDVVEKIVNEIKRIHHGEFGVSFGEIVNYVLGQGDLAFNLQNEFNSYIQHTLKLKYKNNLINIFFLNSKLSGINKII